MNPPDKPDRIVNKALAGGRPAVEEAPCESGNRHVALRECLGELIGTYILVFFGVGAVHVAVLTGAYAGLWQVAAVWGVAVAMAIYATSDVSGAHINPAITIAMAAYRGFPVRKIPAYVAAQLAGAIAAAATLYALFCNMISAFEATRQIVRGESGSELSAMIYGEYFPNPGIVGASSEVLSSLSLSQAMLAEAIGTAMLAFFVFAVTEPRNSNKSGGALVALFVGLGLAIIISIIAPLTQAGLNPARDFGPRLFSCFAGWGEIAIPGPRGGFFTVYILAPIVGALVGSGIYQYLIRPALPRRADDQVDSQVLVTRKHEVGQVPGWKGLEYSPHPQTRQRKMEKTRLILVGGFLGAGKTTLLAQAAERLKRQGKRVGLITNDQAANLVDTATLTQEGLPVSEVSGGCFCCHFDELVSASQRLMDEYGPDVILAEPVGSCTDISATVLQPLKKFFANSFQVAPFSVLVDPMRLRESLQSNGKRAFPESVFYIFAKQLEEADLIVVNKADAVYPCEMTQLENMLWEHFPNKPVLGISALRGKGVDTWLNFVVQDKPAGECIAEVDYDIYAEGEALLGWLNAVIQLATDANIDWRRFCLTLLDSLQTELRCVSAEIAHVKLRLTAGGESIVANLTSTGGEPSLQGVIDATNKEATLLFNARAHIQANQLRAVFERCLGHLGTQSVRVSVLNVRSFSPARPQPTHRFRSAVSGGEQ